MSSRTRVVTCQLALFVFAWCTLLPKFNSLHAEVITLKNGMQFEGSLGNIYEIGEDPLNPKKAAGGVRVNKIILIDDNLRRVFVSTNNLALEPTGGIPGRLVRITIEQRVARNGRRIAGVGPIIRVQPWDDFGRRIFTMNGSRGPVDIIQGITEITPTYTKVEGLLGRNPYVWDMRIATSSIPREKLSKILLKQLDPKNSADRVKIVQLYIQAERYQDAQRELDGVIKDFPGLKALTKQKLELTQSGARRLIQEIELRAEAGQNNLAFRMLRGFPTENVAGETLVTVREMLGEYEDLQKKGERVLELFNTHIAEVKDESKKERVTKVLKEIDARLNFNSLDRMAAYLRLSDDDSLTAEHKLSLAISGWLLGGDSASENLAVSLDQFEVRNLAVEYLRSTLPHEREEILKKLEELEGSHPKDLSKIVKNMLPPIATQAPETEVPGFLELSVPGLKGEPDFNYIVQLPPEYDPQRKYPCIVTLNGSGTTPKKQIDWWAGSFNQEKGARYGQATRHGYIVVAPLWSSERQTKYKYSAREHAAVLYTLRDVSRRFSVDTDRVFLSGHSMGGDAVWDIGLSHPDLFAGVIPIVATADKYITRYWKNAHYVPFYFVTGERDGNRTELNKTDFNRYLRYANFDVVIAQYQGRGHEDFHDEVQNLFAWMNRQRRDFFPKEFECVSMRPWDNFFWWAEMDEFPESTMVLPLEWPTKSAEALTTGKIQEGNSIYLSPGGRKAKVWLSPEMVDFDERIRITTRGSRSRATQIVPSAKVLLDDVRTRGDRQHPFWAKYEPQ